MRHQIPLPRAWNRQAKAAILPILALSHYTFTALGPFTTEGSSSTTDTPEIWEHLDHRAVLPDDEERRDAANPGSVETRSTAL